MLTCLVLLSPIVKLSIIIIFLALANWMSSCIQFHKQHNWKISTNISSNWPATVQLDLNSAHISKDAQFPIADNALLIMLFSSFVLFPIEPGGYLFALSCSAPLLFALSCNAPSCRTCYLYISVQCIEVPWWMILDYRTFWNKW